MEQQQCVVGHSVKIEIGPSICRLAIDFLPITAVPEGEQVFVSGIEIVSVACETDPLGLRTSPDAENAILALCLSCFIQRYYDKV